MREYPMKKGFSTSMEDVKRVVEKFTKEYTINGDIITFKLPGLSSVDVKCGQKHIMVETKNDDHFDDPMRAIKAYNNLLFDLTGLDTKERKKKLSKI